ncbi:O-antigen ligase family protein [Chroococcus sp. FPU101]|uniref:O-antigen ligase family protein n=1 Tax=Chroococcus sp. FPU101 TaxID=1974212 RepID=UPI001A8D0229|nr:O-antigen ligase family protein [Chroococcus sp. FPU101]GFE68199.1 unknown protein [Chroococcus sp. FPU101]
MSSLYNPRQQSFTKGNSFFNLQPASAWMAILGLVVFTLLGVLGAGKIVRLAFPVASFGVGVFLYQRYSTFYISFCWWIWFLAPLIRRLIDFRSGYQDQSIILITPFLISLIPALNFLQYILKKYPYRQGGLPFILALIGILYSFSIGLTNILDHQSSLTLMMRRLIEWISPITFGFYILANWRNYPNLKQNLQRTFFWGAIVMGGYGLIQFFFMPPWDLYWREKVVELRGFANVEHTIWSTSNSNGHFAALMIPCLILLFNHQNTWRIPVAIVSILAFLLAQVRTAWAACIIGIVLLISNLHPRLQIRIILALLVLLLAVFPLATVEPFSSMLDARFQSFSNLEDDVSLNSRQLIYQAYFERALLNPFGHGIASIDLADSGVIVMFHEMGWLGVLPYGGGLVLLFLQMFQKTPGRFDSSLIASRATACSIFAMMPNGVVVTALPGVIFWGFAGFVIAGHKYYQQGLLNKD